MTSSSISEHYEIAEFTQKNASNCASSFYTVKKNWFNGVNAEILAPDSCISTITTVNGSTSYFDWKKVDSTSEESIIIIIAVTFIMLILITISWRSKNPYAADWFRFFSIYAAATLMFVFILLFGPSTPGFSRFVGFAVVVHNFAEIYLLRLLWFGTMSSPFIGIGVIVLYVVFMVSCLAFLPMNGLYLLAMFQGATMDYLFCVTFPVGASKLKKFEWNRCDFILASVAAIIHIISIQPLFIGFVLGIGQITGITTLGLFPTFFFYTYFSGRELGRLGFLGPSYDELLTYYWASSVLDKEHEIEIKGNDANGDSPNALGASTAATTDVNGNVDTSLTQDIRSRTQKKALTQAVIAGNFNALDDSIRSFSGQVITAQENIDRASAFAKLGMIRFFKMSNWEVAACFLGAAGLSLMNSLLIWYAPCSSHPGCQN